MRIVVLVEGETEKQVLRGFFRAWLKSQQITSVGLDCHSFDGCDHMENDLCDWVHDRLASRSGSQVCGIVGLMDLHGPDFLEGDTPRARYVFGQQHFTKHIQDDRFRMHFAVPETEAWLFGHSDVFDARILKRLPKHARSQPEQLRSPKLPAKLLNDAYEHVHNRSYQKVKDGKKLFEKCDPAVAADACPFLKELLADLLELARKPAG